MQDSIQQYNHKILGSYKYLKWLCLKPSYGDYVFTGKERYDIKLSWCFLTLHHLLISFTNFNTQFLYSLTICILHYNPRHVLLPPGDNPIAVNKYIMFRALTCPSSRGQIVLSQHLVSSLSVNGCTVRRMRADSWL